LEEEKYFQESLDGPPLQIEPPVRAFPRLASSLRSGIHRRFTERMLHSRPSELTITKKNTTRTQPRGRTRLLVWDSRATA
jgi:hypothetical protein